MVSIGFSLLSLYFSFEINYVPLNKLLWSVISIVLWVVQVQQNMDRNCLMFRMVSYFIFYGLNVIDVWVLGTKNIMRRQQWLLF
jgi:hypothetical protein